MATAFSKLSSNVKKFLEILLTKNKRGLTVDEYDFKVNDTKYDEIDDHIGGSISLIEAEQYEHEEKIKEQAKRELKKEQEEIKHKNVVEVIDEDEDDDNEDYDNLAEMIS